MPMTEKRRRRSPRLEPLEERVQLSTLIPASVSLGAGTPLATTGTQTLPLSITLPAARVSNEIDIAFLLDDTGSFDKAFGQTVNAIFDNLVTTLQTVLPDFSFGFGVARFEDYGGPGTVFSQDLVQARPFLLDQPIVTAATAAAHATTLDALMSTAFGEIGQGNGGDTPEPDFQALYQIATGAGFDGNGNGSMLDSGPAGSVQAATTPGVSGDIPPFSSNTALTSGSLGGIGWRPGAEHIVLLATDTAPVTAFPNGANPQSVTLTGMNGLTLPAADVESSSGRVGYVSTSVGAVGTGPQPAVVPLGGATVQAALTALNNLGIQVVGMGPGAGPTTLGGPSTAPSPFFSALAELTGAVNPQTGLPLVFSTTVANDQLSQSMIASIETLIAKNMASQTSSAAVNVSLNVPSLPSGVTFSSAPSILPDLNPGATATFEVTVSVASVPYQGTFDASFVNAASGGSLGTVPFTVSLPAQSPSPPTVVAAKRVGRGSPTYLVLTFSTAMDAASVDNPANYVLTNSLGRIDPIALAAYNPRTNSVTLRTKLALNFNRYYKLEIHALGTSGVRSAAGVGLDGLKTGKPGNDYVATVYRFSVTPRLP